ncbi:MAG: hypothetical protein V1732_04560 [Patescibacteria group bacterium]
MFFKNTKSIRALIFLAAASLLTVPYIAKAQWDISGPSTLIDDELDVVLENIVVGILGFIGILGILYLVYGGIRYVTSAGNDSDMEEAKKIIMYAIWGLFLTASAYAIVKTVIAFAS